MSDKRCAFVKELSSFSGRHCGGGHCDNSFGALGKLYQTGSKLDCDYRLCGSIRPFVVPYAGYSGGYCLRNLVWYGDCFDYRNSVDLV